MTTYAIVETGGKQYKVQPGDTIRVELLSGDEGDLVELNDVRMVSENGEVTLGSPSIPGASVSAEVLGQGKGKKVIIFKYKAKTRYRRKNGHRQWYTELKISGIKLG